MSTYIFRERCRNGKIAHTTHFNQPALVETKPIQLVQIPITGEELHQSVLLHPRYAPKGMDAELIEVTGLRRGRTIEILLDKPIVIDGVEYTILNFKGVGADANQDMMIHPAMWYGDFDFPDTWIYKKAGDIYNRLWGALRQDHGKEEFNQRDLPNLGIPMVPHLTLNDIPNTVAQQIARVVGWKKILPICQLVRGMITNIRFEDVIYGTPPLHSIVEIDQIVEIDAKVILAQFKLLKQRKMIKIQGEVKENRLANGEFIDAENFMVDYFFSDASTIFLGKVMEHSLEMLIGMKDYEAKARYYLQKLEDKTGLGFLREMNLPICSADESAFSTVRRAIEYAAASGCELASSSGDIAFVAGF